MRNDAHFLPEHVPHRGEAPGDQHDGAREGDELAAELTELFGGDPHDPRVETLRAWMTSVREQAAADREDARKDRETAARDRKLAARDRQAAGTDELTGARRRGVGLEEFDREIDRARRTDTGLVAVFVDVDNLKDVNDELGHRTGDQLLRNVVEGLKRHLRSYDLIIRLGGDEFLCGLPGVTLDQARTRFADLNVELRNASPQGSVSIGFSELRDHETTTEVIDRADHDLMAARTRRRFVRTHS